MRPVHLAASLGRLKMLQDLKQYGADLTVRDEVGMTALDRGKLYNHSEIVEFL
jgi:ankyrin repeat protein